MSQKLLSFLLFFSFATFSFSQKVIKVHGEYIYHAPDNVSLSEAKKIALERAKTQAIADQFGTIITQENVTRIKNDSKESSVDMFSLSSSEVKGEWIETLDEPIYDIFYEQDILNVKVSVTGKIREIVHSKIDLELKILRNGVEDKFENNTFHNGDDLYMSFKSPTDGYLAVYLIDKDKNAYCLLPYKGQTSGIYKIIGGQKYVFFSEKAALQADKEYVEEYEMTCETSSETNVLYVVFSQNEFAKAIDTDNSDDIPRELSFDDFHKWLTKHKVRDNKLICISKTIEVLSK